MNKKPLTKKQIEENRRGLLYLVFFTRTMFYTMLACLLILGLWMIFVRVTTEMIGTEVVGSLIAVGCYIAWRELDERANNK